MSVKMKSYEELTFTDDFMFCKVMENNEDICKELLELIIDRKVKKIVRVDKQKPIEITADGKGVRFDVYIEDEKEIFNIEMQNQDYDDLARRARYYQGMIDASYMDRGSHYSDLKNSYVIFINKFDKYERGLHKYTFVNKCIEIPELEMGDGTTKIFVNSNAKCGKIKPEMRAFLDYLTNGMPTDDFTEKIETEVTKAKNNYRWKGEFMTLYEKIQIEGDKRYKDGLSQGITQGIALKCVEDVDNIMKKSFSLEDACDLIGISVTEYEKYKKQFASDK